MSFHRSKLGFDWFIPSFTEILLGYIRFLFGFTGFSRVLIDLNWVLIGLYQVLPGFTGFL